MNVNTGEDIAARRREDDSLIQLRRGDEEQTLVSLQKDNAALQQYARRLEKELERCRGMMVLGSLDATNEEAKEDTGEGLSDYHMFMINSPIL